MASQPTPEEASEALWNVGHRSDQARGSMRAQSRWLDVFFGVVIFLYCASSDFYPRSNTWKGWALCAIIIGYSALLRSRRGSALLGRPARVHREAISPRFTLIARLAIVLLVVCSLLAILILGATHTDTHVPYLSTAIGAILAIVLIAFGPWLRSGLVTLAGRGHRAGRTPDGRS